MRQIPHDKYTVAWFTLAECVARGEKVRALAVYRLLAHSIDDPAFRRQLEGDILLAFKDTPLAITKYIEAAALYEEQGRYAAAAGLYEHICELNPTMVDSMQKLSAYYEKLGNIPKAIGSLQLLFTASIESHDRETARAILARLDVLAPSSTVSLHQQMVFALLRAPAYDMATVLEHIHITIDKITIVSDTPFTLQRFLSTLEALHQEYAIQALDYTKAKDRDHATH